MDLLWRRAEPATVREVLEAMDRVPPLAYTTVLSVMDNLHSKGYLTRRRLGRAYVYTPKASREEHTAALLGEVLADSTDRSAALMHFVGHLSPAEVADLRAALAERPVEQPAEDA
jgi:predicted transcriptional regulator